jgi:hypothetical protein
MEYEYRVIIDFGNGTTEELYNRHGSPFVTKTGAKQGIRHDKDLRKRWPDHYSPAQYYKIQQRPVDYGWEHCE